MLGVPSYGCRRFEWHGVSEGLGAFQGVSKG